MGGSDFFNRRESDNMRHETIHEDIYEVSVKWDNAQQGTVAKAPQFKIGIDRAWSPEFFFTAAVNSCFTNTFINTAQEFGLKFVSFESKALGKVEQGEGRYMMSQVTLMPILTLADAKDKALADWVMQKAGSNCLMANSVKSTIIFRPTLVIDGE